MRDYVETGHVLIFYYREYYHINMSEACDMLSEDLTRTVALSHCRTETTGMCGMTIAMSFSINSLFSVLVIHFSLVTNNSPTKMIICASFIRTVFISAFSICNEYLLSFVCCDSG